MHSENYQWPAHAPSIDLKSASHSFSNPSLKRQRPDLSTPPSSSPAVGSGARMSALPPIPKLNGEVLLDVFTHRSLRFEGAPINDNSEYGDNMRLSTLGEAILRAAVMDTFFKKRPMLTSDELLERCKQALSPTNIETWIRGYKLKDKLRCSPDAVSEIDSPAEMRLLFTSYLGAVYASQGMVVVQNWVGALVDPEYEPMETDIDQHNYPKKVKTEAYSPPPAFSSYAHAVPSEPVSMPPPPPPANPPPPLPNPMTPAQPSTAFLPMFNQTANQRRVFVEYPAQFSGPPHAGRWTVKCVVNGIEKGTGSGASKQLAKEEAAKQAWYAMGWAARA